MRGAEAQVLVVVFTVWLPVQEVNVGASVSLTITRKVQVLVCPTPSVAFHCTVVVPFGNVALLFGLPVTCPVPPKTHVGCPAGRVQLSEAVGLA